MEDSEAITPPIVDSPSQGWEYWAEKISLSEPIDSASLVQRLNDLSSDGWDLVTTLSASSEAVFIFRRMRKIEKPTAPVGFRPLPRENKTG
jgi:hypothetical protein